MSVILERQDTGDQFQIDAVLAWTVSRNWRPTESPIEASPGSVVTTITDQVQALPVVITLDALVTETPPREDRFGTGPARLVAFSDWLVGAAGVLLNVYPPDRPTLRGYVVTTYPEETAILRDLRARVSLTAITIVESGTVQIPNQRRVRADAKAGLAPTVDKGPAPTEEVSTPKKSTIISAFDLVFGGAI